MAFRKDSETGFQVFFEVESLRQKAKREGNTKGILDNVHNYWVSDIFPLIKSFHSSLFFKSKLDKGKIKVFFKNS